MNEAVRGAWGVGAIAAVATGVVALAAATVVPIEAKVPAVLYQPLPPSTVLSPVYRADSLAAATVARDPFRFDRRAASAAYDPQRAAVAVDVAQPPKPVLLLVGIVAAAEPTAVIEGFPGVAGARVVRVGDEIAGLRVRSISADEVGVAGLDTTWKLTVREPWR